MFCTVNFFSLLKTWFFFNYFLKNLKQNYTCCYASWRCICLCGWKKKKSNSVFLIHSIWVSLLIAENITSKVYCIIQEQMRPPPPSRWQSLFLRKFSQFEPLNCTLRYNNVFFTLISREFFILSVHNRLIMHTLNKNFNWSHVFRVMNFTEVYWPIKNAYYLNFFFFFCLRYLFL